VEEVEVMNYKVMKQRRYFSQDKTNHLDQKTMRWLTNWSFQSFCGIRQNLRAVLRPEVMNDVVIRVVSC
jgi:hypothetical protein